MSVPIRIGFHTSNAAKIEELNELRELKILETAEIQYQRCKKCGGLIYIDPPFLNEGLKSCPFCFKTAKLSKDKIIEHKITKINYKQIFDICNSELIKFVGNEFIIADSSRHCWVYRNEGKNIPIVISEISSYAQFINNSEDLCWLCIVIDWDANRGKLNNYNVLNFIKLEDILFNEVNLHERLKQISATFSTNTVIELEKQFDLYIKKISGTDFESDFINTFWREVKEKMTQIERYLRFLSDRHDTIINSKIVYMGGPGNADFAVLDLHEYLQEIFNPDKIGESKRYQHNELKSTEFSWGDFTSALGHADEADALFLLSTNDIAPSVWRRVIEKRRQTGYYKYAIIDKDVILLLIKVLGIEEMLSKPVIPIERTAKRRARKKEMTNHKKSVHRGH